MLYKARKFSSDVLKRGPREAAHLPVRRVCLAYWTLCCTQKGVTYSYNLCCLPCSGGPDTGCNPGVEWSSSTSPCQFDMSVSPRDQREWDEQGGSSPATSGVDLPPFSFFSLGCCLQPVTESPWSLRFYDGNSCFCLMEGKPWFQQSIFFSASMIFLNLSISSATWLSRSSTWSSLLPSITIKML